LKWLKKSVYFNTPPQKGLLRGWVCDNSSHVGGEDDDIEVGMDDLLWDTQAMDGILLDVFQQK
jgi:hypothetical protein